MSDFGFLSKVPVQVQKSSGFDKSFQNIFTMPVGTLVPALCDELIPNTKVKLKMAISAALPPLASDTFMRCQLKAEAFFVPTRLLWQNWPKFCVGKFYEAPPTVNIRGSLTGVGSLSDYLGIRTGNPVNSSANVKATIFPYLSYHKVWSDWYRATLVQNDCFSDDAALAENDIQNLPMSSSGNFDLDTEFLDGVALGSLRQRNFGLDYFTTATPSPQNGAAQKVKFDTSAAEGNFSISALRASNSMQVWMERNNLAGDRYIDFVRSQYGAHLADGVAQRSLLLGSGSYDVYTKGIYQTMNGSQAPGTNNPFDQSVGAQFGSARASGSDFLIDFTAQEHGYLMVLVSLVPKVTYSSGIRKYLTRYTAAGSITDMANPILQNTGNEPIMAYEVGADSVNGYIDTTSVFGYTERFASYKCKEDELHGLMRDGQSLQSFALQRYIDAVDGSPQINSEFLEIPKDYLDQVSATNQSISQYGCWVDAYFDYKVVMPLARYSVPSLADYADHSHKSYDVVMDRGGKHL